MKVLNCTDKMHNEFVKNHPNGDMGQLTYWGELKEMNGWTWEKVDVGEDKIKGAALLLFKRIPKLGLSFCYANRGFVVDWEDAESAKALTKAVLHVAKKHGAILVRIDPEVAYNEELCKKIKQLGFSHKGLEKGLYPYTQPRIHMTTDLHPELPQILKTFQSRTRTQVRKSLKNGLVFERAPIEKMDIFYQIMIQTGERDAFAIRGLDYFERMYEKFHPSGDCELFLIKVLPKEALKQIKEDLDKREEEKHRLMKKDKAEAVLEEVERGIENIKTQYHQMLELEQKHPDGLYLSGAIYTQCGERAYYLYGASSNAYRDLLPNYFMQWKMMEYAKAHGATNYDFGGITGKEGEENDEAPGLYEFKKRWGSEKIERIGEFDYVLKPFWYKLMEKAIAWRKKRAIGDL